MHEKKEMDVVIIKEKKRERNTKPFLSASFASKNQLFAAHDGIRKSIARNESPSRGI